jgi:hypothetical protein
MPASVCRIIGCDRSPNALLSGRVPSPGPIQMAKGSLSYCGAGLKPAWMPERVKKSWLILNGGAQSLSGGARFMPDKLSVFPWVANADCVCGVGAGSTASAVQFSPNSIETGRLMKSNSIIVVLFASLTAMAAPLAMPVTARAGEIFITADNGRVEEYTTAGATVNSALITVGRSMVAIAVSGGDVFVPNNEYGTISEYTTSGALVNASLVTGLSDSVAVAVSGNDLFVVEENGGTIGEYTTSGSIVNASLVTGLSSPQAIAVSGNDLFVADNNGHGVGEISEYTTSGALLNASLVTGVDVWGIAVSGNDLFVTNSFTSSIGEYTTSGATVNASLIADSDGPLGIAVSGTDLFVVNYAVSDATGSIGEYTTSGATVNASLIAGQFPDLYEPWAIAVTPEPSTWVMLAIGAAALLARGLRRRRVQAGR